LCCRQHPEHHHARSRQEAALPSDGTRRSDVGLITQANIQPPPPNTNSVLFCPAEI
jgi:hypothetical protein